MQVVNQKHIDDIMEQSSFETTTLLNRVTIVSCVLPNGFIITESSACNDEENFDIELGTKICKQKIKNRLYELEGYSIRKLNKI